MATHISQSTLKYYLAYDHLTGIFTWRNPPKGRTTNDTPGTVMYDGTVLIRLNGRAYTGAKLAWLYVTGDYPNEPVVFDKRYDDPYERLKFRNLRLRSKMLSNTRSAERQRIKRMYKKYYQETGSYEHPSLPPLVDLRRRRDRGARHSNT